MRIGWPSEITEQAQQQRGVLLLFGHEEFGGAQIFAITRSCGLAQQLFAVTALAELEPPDRFDQRAAHRIGDIAAVVECDGRVGLGVHVLVLLEMLDPQTEDADVAGPVASWSPG